MVYLRGDIYLFLVMVMSHGSACLNISCYGHVVDYIEPLCLQR
uniref:Uncharacterized protein n=1 Tax=Arundo donax TaxID=35708 RepID=A0A0A9AMS5_ARUDO